MILIFSGLPGVGKTTIARRVAQEIAALYLRIDTVEQALVRLGLVAGDDIGPCGYMVGYALALENVRLGLDVVVDAVNPLCLTRDAWENVAIEVGVPYLEIEVLCADVQEHQRRVATRTADIYNHALPDWQAVCDRDYEPWDRPHMTLDTALLSATECVAVLVQAVAEAKGLKTIQMDMASPHMPA